jgi:opacity protein-like surface antigen
VFARCSTFDKAALLGLAVLSPLAISLSQAAEPSRPRNGAAQSETALRGGLDDSTPDDVNTWTVFGFTEGADVGVAGERGVGLDVVARAGRAHRSYIASEASVQYSANPVDGLSLSLSLFPGHTRWAGSAALRGTYSETYAGLAAGAKIQLLHREQAGFGMSIELTPYVTRGAQSLGRDFVSIGGDAKANLDAALIPGHLYGAVNFAYSSERVQSSGGIPKEDASTFIASAGTAFRLPSNVFLGAELRYLSRFDSLFPRQAAGWGLFAGPTIFVLYPWGYVGLAWSHQMTGRALATPDLSLNTFNLERQQWRLKAGMGF